MHLDKRKDMPKRITRSFGAYLECSFLPTAQSQPTPSLVILTLSASSTRFDITVQSLVNDLFDVREQP
jgi:hypothetical protein